MFCSAARVDSSDSVQFFARQGVDECRQRRRTWNIKLLSSPEYLVMTNASLSFMNLQAGIEVQNQSFSSLSVLKTEGEAEENI